MVPQNYKVVAVMGGCTLDLRAAQLSAPVTTIRIIAIMGGVEIIVPPGVRVIMRGIPIMGGWSNTAHDVEQSQDSPEIRIDGIAIMGGVDVRTK